MATSYTSLLGLALPVTGELAGTWGDTVNNAITSLLDSAVAGTTTLSADTDVTLTTTTGASNQARQAILLCSGARTALRTITAPAQSKIYVVINNTTGGYGVKLVGAGPTTGVTVAAGKTAVLVWNGSDFIEVAPATATTATNLAGGATGSVPYQTGSGATTFLSLGTAAQVLQVNAGATAPEWVSSTGTGNVVRASSPTIATPTITTSATVPLLIGGTDTTSTLTLRSTSGVGTTGADIIFQTGNNGATEVMRILNNGRVGIGTNSPASTLDVIGGIRSASGSNNVNIRHDGTNGSITGNGGSLLFYATSANNMIFHTNGVERARIDSTGNVGIGNAIPAVKLDVTGAAAISTSTTTPIVIGGTGTTSPLTLRSTSGVGTAGADIIFQTGNNGATEAMRILNSGYVGIGTNAPNATLQVGSGSIAPTLATGITVQHAYTPVVSLLSPSATAATARLTFGNETSKELGIFRYTYSTGELTLQASGGSTNGNFTFYTNGTLRATIDSSGRVLIGATAARTSYAVIPPLQTEALSAGTSGASFTLNSVNSEGPNVFMTKTRGTSVGSNTTVVTGDTIGNLYWAAADGTDTASVVARISAAVEGTVGTAVTPGILRFATTGAGANFPSERMRIDSSGNVLVGSATLAAAGAAGIQVGSGKQLILASGNADFLSNLDAPLIYASATGGGINFNGHLVLQPRGSAAGAILFATGNGAAAMAERARIDSNGILLVNATTPIANTRVHIAQNSDANYSTTFTPGTTKAQLVLRDVSDTGTYTTPFSLLSFAAGSSGAGASYISGAREGAGASFLAFGTGTASTATERMRIDSSGNVGIGVSPSNTLHVSGTTRLVGAIGVNAAPSTTDTALAISTLSTYSAAAQYGLTCQTRASSGASQHYSIYTQAGTQAAAFTLSAAYGLFVVNPSLGAGSTITTNTGVYIEDQTSGGTNYGIRSLVSSGSNKYNLYISGTADNYFSGSVRIYGVGGLGYGTGSGGAVTQATSRTTGVTLDKTNGAITLVSAAGTATWQTFTVTNSTVAATDTIIVNQKSGTDLYQIFVTNVAAGSFKITFATTGGTTTEQPVFNFAVIKAVAA